MGRSPGKPRGGGFLFLNTLQAFNVSAGGDVSEACGIVPPPFVLY